MATSSQIGEGHLFRGINNTFNATMTTTSTSTATTTTTSKTNNVDKGTTSDNGDLPVHCKPEVNPFLDKPILVNAFWIYFPAN